VRISSTSLELGINPAGQQFPSFHPVGLGLVF
jgi:hypothetical protein